MATRLELLARCEKPDIVPGQLSVVDGDRCFAVIRTGRRWTKVPEYLTNGQLTARFFVDEKTGEVRPARSWKGPMNYPLREDDAAWVRGLIEQAS